MIKDLRNHYQKSSQMNKIKKTLGNCWSNSAQIHQKLILLNKCSLTTIFYDIYLHIMFF